MRSVAIVTLVSGGLDSTLMSLLAHEAGIALWPLFIDYGQLGAVKEWEACKNLHEEHHLPEVTRLDLSGYGQVVASGLTNPALRINEDAFLPGRNLLFVLAGAAYAVTVHADGVALGLLDPSGHLFPDQTRRFVEGCEAVIPTAVGKHINILTPLIELSKSDVLRIAQARGLNHTYSCHAGGDTPCGACVACVEIANAQERS